MKTVAKLRAHSVEHLPYEIQMLQETAKRLLHDVALHQDATLKNATVESCVLHARVLTEFLYPDDPWDDDVTSDDYVVDRTSWAAARGGAGVREGLRLAQRHDDGGARWRWDVALRGLRAVGADLHGRDQE